MKIRQMFSFLNGVVLSIMVILAIVLLFTITSLKEDNQWVTHTYEVIHQAERLMSEMVDQETGMRGYLATGNSDYLDPYELASKDFEISIERLKTLVKDNPIQVVKLLEVQALSKRWHLEASDIYLALKREILESEDMRNKLQILTRSGIGKEKMDMIRALIESIEEDNIRLNIINSMINMETGVRAYIINREEKYLEPYVEGQILLNEYLIIANDQRVNDATRDWINSVAEKEIKLVRESLNFKTDDDLFHELSLGKGKSIMDQIRAEIDLFIQIEQKLLIERNQASARQYKLSIISIVLALVLTVLVGMIQRRATKKVIDPLTVFSKQMKEFNPKMIDDQITFDKNAVTEVVDLAQGYGKILKQLKENLSNREEANWLQQGQMDVSSISETFNDIDSLLNHLISYLTKKLKGQYGAIYLLDENNEADKYRFSIGYAIDDAAFMNKSYALGESLVGQAAKENELIIITDLPSDYIKINSGLGYSKPEYLVIIPCTFNDKVIAIIEIASLTEFSDLMLELINKSKPSIGIAISNAMTKSEVRKLLEETRETNEKLSLQKEELKVSNEELESQSNILMRTQSELEAQQEHLRVLNEELEESSASLVQSNKYKSEFLANMSHELRTPLNSILILSELLGDSKELSEDDLKYADTINSSGKGLLTLINDILDLSKVESGQLELDITLLNLSMFKDETMNLFEQVSIKKKLKFIINLSEELPEQILTDEMKLKQIVNNLLSNAFKFTATGIIELNIRDKKDLIEFEVKDTGIGITADKIDLIFSAFKQEDGTISRKYGGTGLGLSISAEYAKLFGGAIEVKSTKGKGSRFILTIPKVIDHNEMSEVYTVSNETVYIPDDRKHIQDDDKVILIIDDDPIFASIVMDISKSNDFKVLVAENGKTGLYLADYYCPIGIILDIGLPDIDGWEVLDRLKANSRTSNIPVNIVSGKDISEKIASTGTRIYQKPITKSEIEGILNETVKKNKKVNKIVTMGITAIDQSVLVELSSSSNGRIEIMDCHSELETLAVLAEQFVDLVVLDLEKHSEQELEFIKRIIDESINSDVSIIVYTSATVTERDERNLSGQVDDIIIKDGDSTQRLLNEIKLFVHNVKENKMESLNNSLDDAKFYGKVVLIVDDDMRNIFALSSILQRVGIVVEMAHDGREALEVLQSLETVDLVLMDIMMPIMDGYEAMRAIRLMDNYKELPIIALTAKAMKGDKEICIQAGANEYLSKPIEKNKLLSLLRVWI